MPPGLGSSCCRRLLRLRIARKRRSSSRFLSRAASKEAPPRGRTRGLWGGAGGGPEGGRSRFTWAGGGRGRQGGGEAQATEPPGWCSAAAGRVVSPFPSSHSGLPTPEAGVLLRPWLEPGCLLPPGVVQPGVAGGSHDGRSSEGSGDWVWGSGRGGQMAHARALPSRSPCPNRFPLSGWVSVSKLRNCCLLRGLPPKQSRFLYFRVLVSVLFEELPMFSASVSPVAH